MDSVRLRSIILNIQDRLSKEDRIRLHFYLGDDVPRRIRDDPSLVGTLNLMDSLIDQDKISEEDFSYLINAFDQIRCADAAKLLREHLNRNTRIGLNQSIQSLSTIMPPLLNHALLDQEDSEEDKQAIESHSIRQQNLSGDNNTTINNNKIDMNQDEVPIIVNNRRESSLRLKRKQPYRKCLLLFFIVLSFLIYAILIFFYRQNNIEIHALKRNYIGLMEIVQQNIINDTQTIQLMDKFRYDLARLGKKIDRYPSIYEKNDTLKIKGTVSTESTMLSKLLNNSITIASMVLSIREAPSNMRSYRGNYGQTYTFSVTGSCNGSIWGTNIYTDDSDLATAAVHAGFAQCNVMAIINVQVLSGQSNHTGSTQNGITSNSYGSWLGSYTFVNGTAL